MANEVAMFRPPHLLAVLREILESKAFMSRPMDTMAVDIPRYMSNEHDSLEPGAAKLGTELVLN